MASDKYETRQAEQKDRSSDGAGISEDEIRRFLELVEAVQAKNADARSDGPDDSDSERRRRESVFGYDVISALTGRNVPPGNSFTKALARVERKSDSLTIQLFDPTDGTSKPAKEGLAVHILVESSVVAAEVGKEGVVPLGNIKTTQDITSLTVRDKEGRPIAIAGLVTALRASRAGGS